MQKQIEQLAIIYLKLRTINNIAEEIQNSYVDEITLKRCENSVKSIIRRMRPQAA